MARRWLFKVSDISSLRNPQRTHTHAHTHTHIYVILKQILELKTSKI